MTLGQVHRSVVLVIGSLFCFWLACDGTDEDAAPKWNCVAAGDGCTCTQLKPGQLPRPGVEYIDRCPAAQCCLHNSQGDEISVAVCICITVADDCQARAARSPQTKVVVTCPPP